MAGKLVHFELPAKDGERARKFYSSLLGWKFHDSGTPGLDYFMTEGIEPVAAVYTTDEGKTGPIVYFDVDDIDAAISAAKKLGGKADDKMPVPGQGWFSACVDTEGNPFSLWEADTAAPMPEQQEQPASSRA
jgi:predicted enzyme related to lactoylglutathione lyase